MTELIDKAKVLQYLTPRIKTWTTPYGEGYNRALEDAAELVTLMPAAEPARWIPCSERLPEQGQRVIAQFRCGDTTAISTAWRAHSGSWIVDCMRYADKERVTVQAWRPTPEAYEPPETEEGDEQE